MSLPRRVISSRFSKKNLCLLGLFLAGASILSRGATPYALANTDVRTLPVSANGRSYTLSVSVPSSYASSPGRRYPVVYFGDGYWDFPLFAMDAGNLQVDGLIPEVILVGIGYAGDNPDVGALRQIDFTPGVDSSIDPSGTTSGKAQQFLDVIATEFIPFIESNYRADPSVRVLAGSSYGGLFTLYTAFTRPDLFQGYLASSPAVWWRNRFVQSLENSYSQIHSSLPARIFISIAGDESSSIMSSATALYQQFKTHFYTGLSLAFWQVDAERHSSQKPESFNRGLRFLLANLAPNPTRIADPAYNERPHLINVSTRGAVGIGDSVLIGGFIVAGVNNKRILVRAVGPKLSDYGVAGVLADPLLTIHNSAGTTVAQNDNWNDGDNGVAVSDASTATGAFALNQGSRDAAMVVTLPPGGYTIVVQGVSGGTGVALVEAYELPAP